MPGKFQTPASSAPSATGAVSPGDDATSYTDAQVVDSIEQVAKELDIPFSLAWADAVQESNGNTFSLEKDGTGVGLYQLSTPGEGSGYSTQEKFNPTLNSEVALGEYQQIAAADPALRGNPGEWAAKAQRPLHPNAYARSVNAYLRKFPNITPAQAITQLQTDTGGNEVEGKGQYGVGYSGPGGTSIGDELGKAADALNPVTYINDGVKFGVVVLSVVIIIVGIIIAFKDNGAVQAVSSTAKSAASTASKIGEVAAA